MNTLKTSTKKRDCRLREIARQTGKDFRTVRKYAYQDNWNPPVKKLEAEEFPVMGEYIPIVNKWLEDDECEPRKQRHTVSSECMTV